MKSNIIVALTLVFLLGVFALLKIGLGMNPNSRPSPMIGKQVPQFELERIDAHSTPKLTNRERISSTELSGKWVILNFWSSWCTSCESEASELQAFWSQNTEADTLVLGIASQDKKDDSLEFAQRHGKTYPLALDEEGSTAIHFGVTGFPETFVIAPDGRIADKFAGAVTAKQLSEMLQRARQPKT